MRVKLLRRIRKRYAWTYRGNTILILDKKNNVVKATSDFGRFINYCVGLHTHSIYLNKKRKVRNLMYKRKYFPHIK